MQNEYLLAVVTVVFWLAVMSLFAPKIARMKPTWPKLFAILGILAYTALFGLVLFGALGGTLCVCKLIFYVPISILLIVLGWRKP